ncbi:AGAP006277-PA [Anopheles gambiae str. PEST]|uniref:AGAP006277-PA n=1 Tax=Anopheles gambiae TaxID=7165 RepID=A7UU70_ANOGA|nr:AGAP006277-PA [Anopheles gambiae str. PEST]
MMLELKLILLCLPSILLATTLDSDNKSILANTDWKKLWLESGQLSSSGRIDNHLDSSDSTLIDDGEVSWQLFKTPFHACLEVSSGLLL